MKQANLKHLNTTPINNRFSSKSESADVLADIYQDDVNISIWKRTISPELKEAANRIIDAKPSLKLSTSLDQQSTLSTLFTPLGANADAKLVSEDVRELVSMFSYLFDLKTVGLRLAVLDSAMCPKFHVDRVPCRLVTTYCGIATQWISHNDVDRSKLGMGSQGKGDEESGIYRDINHINQLTFGDVAILKGESWLGNEGAGLVHRSPNVRESNKRLLLTLDFN